MWQYLIPVFASVMLDRMFGGKDEREETGDELLGSQADYSRGIVDLLSRRMEREEKYMPALMESVFGFGNRQFSKGRPSVTAPGVFEPYLEPYEDLSFEVPRYEQLPIANGDGDGEDGAVDPTEPPVVVVDDPGETILEELTEVELEDGELPEDIDVGTTEDEIEDETEEIGDVEDVEDADTVVPEDEVKGDGTYPGVYEDYPELTAQGLLPQPYIPPYPYPTTEYTAPISSPTLGGVGVRGEGPLDPEEEEKEEKGDGTYPGAYEDYLEIPSPEVL